MLSLTGRVRQHAPHPSRVRLRCCSVGLTVPPAGLGEGSLRREVVTPTQGPSGMGRRAQAGRQVMPFTAKPVSCVTGFVVAAWKPMVALAPGGVVAL